VVWDRVFNNYYYLIIIIIFTYSCFLRLRSDLYCVGWGVKLYSLTHQPMHIAFRGDIIFDANNFPDNQQQQPGIALSSERDTD